MLFGEVARRVIPMTDKEKACAIEEMVKELLDRTIPVFDSTTFIIHESDGFLTVGMKWKGANYSGECKHDARGYCKGP